MKAFFKKYQALHLWLAVALALLAAWFLGRTCRPAMNAIQTHLTGPLRALLGEAAFLVDFSVMEVLVAGLVLYAAFYLAWSVVRVVREKGRRRERACRSVLFALCVTLTICDGFCLLWGVNYWTDTFQERSGIYGEPVAPEDLLNVTVYVARNLLRASEDVPRDERGVFAVPREEILAASPMAYDRLEGEMPFLAFDDTGVKPMTFSRFMSAIDFTGFYCPYTGEPNVNVDSPACLLPATACHEMAHQRGIASEQECNFLAVLAAVTSEDPAYVYSGWLKAYIHVGNALYTLSPELYWAIREQLPAGVRADLDDNTAYWDQFRDTVAQKVSTTAYDQMLKVYGEERGIQSYGMVVDLLVAYYKDAAAAQM